MPNANEWLAGLFSGGGRALDVILALRQAAQEREDSRKRFETTNKSRALELEAARLEREAEREFGRKEREQSEFTRQRERGEDIQRTERAGQRQAKQQSRLEARQTTIETLTPYERQGFLFDPTIRASLREAAMPSVGRRLMGTPERDVKGQARAAGPDLAGLTAEAQRRSRQGLEGATIRAPQPGVFKGVSFQPETVSVTQPRAGTGLRDSAALGTLASATQRLHDMEAVNPLHATIPNTSVVARTGARWVDRMTGVPAGDPESLAEIARQSQFSSEQREYQALADEFTHNYIAELPHFRSSREMYQNIRHAFFPRAGQEDPRLVAALDLRRQGAVARMEALRRRGASVEEQEAEVLRTIGSPIAQTATGRPVGGVPGGTRSGSGTGPQLNPRFLGTP